VTVKGQGRDPNIFKAHYFETARDRESVTMGHLYKTDAWYRIVTWPM